MKTKILKQHGWWKLVVQDEAINQKYKCTNDKPIVLGVITNFGESGCWAAQDYRMKKNLLPSPYLDDSLQEFMPKNEFEKETILKAVKSPTIEDNGVISWHKFDTYLFDGDNPSHTSSFGVEFSILARFTFKTALKRLQEQKTFWDQFDKEDLTLEEIRLPNPHRQLGDSDFFNIFFEQRMEDKRKLKM
jgi:hypothetical protein